MRFEPDQNIGDLPDLSSEFSKIVNASLSPVAYGLGILYLGLGFSHLYILETTLSRILAPLAFLSFVLLVGLGFAASKYKRDEKYAHVWASVIYIVVFANSAIHLYLSGDPKQTTNISLALIGLGIFFLSYGWFAGAMAVSLVVWGMIGAAIGPSPDWEHYYFFQVEAVVLSILVFFVRERVYKSFILSRHEEIVRAAEAQRTLDEFNYERKVWQDKESRYNLLVERSSEVVYTIDAEGRFDFANPSAVIMSGYEMDELIGMVFTDLVTASMRTQVRAFYIRQLEKKIDQTTYSFPIMTKWGEEKWVEQVVSAIWDGDEIVGFQALVRDVTTRKQVEEELRRQALVYENIYESVILTDMSGRIMDCNPATEKLFGYSRAEVIGQVSSLWHKPEETEALTKDIIEGIRKEGRWQGEINFLRKDGTEGYCEAVIFPLFDDGGEQIATIGVSHDVTERKRAEDDLLAQKLLYERLVAIARAITEGYSLEDTLENALGVAVEMTHAERGSLFMINEMGVVTHSILYPGRAERGAKGSIVGQVMDRGLAGWIVKNRETVLIKDTLEDDRWLTMPDKLYQARSILGLPIESAGRLSGILTLIDSKVGHFTNDHRELMRSAVDQMAMALRNAQMFDDQLRMAQQQSILFESLRSITRHLEPETVLQTAVESIRQLVEWPSVSVLLPDETGDYLVVKAVSGFLGETRGVKVPVGHGISWRTFEMGIPQSVSNVKEDPDYYGDNEKVVSELCIPLWRGEEMIGVLTLQSDQEIFFGSVDNYLMESLADIIALSLENAQLYATVLESQDELLVAIDEAEAANYAKSAFLANMSHELRTPLHAIIGFSDFLKEDPDILANEENASDIKKINEAGSDLLSMIDDILEISKIEAGRISVTPENIAVKPFVDDIVASFFMRAMNKNLVLESNVEEIGDMYTDPTHLHKALTNIIDNGIKFTESGSVTISAYRQTVDRYEFVNFVVTDTGIGMTEAQKEGLFQMFSQADVTTTRKYGGTGLGTAISHRLVRLTGGTIVVDTEVGKGSTFTLQIPANIPPNLIRVYEKKQKIDGLQ